ncbi:hypothetical protein BDP27DRAFT_1331893 [Rhodocollybia butyracea]|uniref:Uncharacterized protein n=1 Tax=Rhodocollybia butyracea TaxID=206335 RepID=A0A9P5U383_9AGAR|nr:hypothetical protein BDP27DRAFT_1331893 [Rhodocollybia butyracea]
MLLNHSPRSFHEGLYGICQDELKQDGGSRSRYCSHTRLCSCNLENLIFKDIQVVDVQRC